MSDIDDFEDILQGIEDEEVFFTQLENISPLNKRRRSNTPEVCNKFDVYGHSETERNSPAKQQCLTVLPAKEKRKDDDKSSNKNLLLDIIDFTSSLNDSYQPIASPETSIIQLREKNEFKENDELLSSRKKLLLDVIADDSTMGFEKSLKTLQKPLRSLPVDSRNLSARNKLAIVQNSVEENVKRIPEKNCLSSYNSHIKNSVPVNLHKSIIRQFPGPAGLIPDDLEDENDVGDVYDIDEAMDNNENITAKRKSSPSLITSDVFYSQDTRKLFSHGAWQFMLDDLPKNFLKHYNISLIKRMKNLDKVPLLAGVISSIDLTRLHPRLLLKDTSGSIMAMMHKDVFVTYEKCLKSGAVLLLRDIGLVYNEGIQNNVTTSLVMITPISILGIYSDTSRLVTTSVLEKLISEFNSSFEAHEMSLKKVNNRHKARAQLLEYLDGQCSAESSIKLSDVQDCCYKYQSIIKMTQSDAKKLFNNSADDAFDSFNINADGIEATLMTAAGEKINCRPDVSTKNKKNYQNSGINKSSKSKNDQLDASTRMDNKSFGFGDHLLDDDSDDDIISQIDMQAFENTQAHSGT